jgi:GNAT superfamily N-acetyltransferase
VNLTDSEYRKCGNLTLGKSGQGRMYPTLCALYTKDPEPSYLVGTRECVENDAWVFLAWEGEQLLGWCLSFESSWDGRQAYFFVHPKHRRKGVGRRLARAVERKFPHARVHCWNQAATAFFQTTALVNN